MWPRCHRRILISHGMGDLLMGGEYSFDDYLMDCDRSEEFTPSEVEAIHAAMRRGRIGAGRKRSVADDPWTRAGTRWTAQSHNRQRIDKLGIVLVSSQSSRTRTEPRQLSEHCGFLPL